MNRASALPAIETFEAASADELIQFGRALATRLPARACLVLTGELGAGKTTLVKGLAAGLGVASPEDVTSPTFTLIHEYHRGGRSLYHIDLYRLDTPRQIATLGLEEMILNAGEQVVAVEWGEKIQDALPRPYLHLTLDTPAPGRRRVRALWAED